MSMVCWVQDNEIVGGGNTWVETYVANLFIDFDDIEEPNVEISVSGLVDSNGGSSPELRVRVGGSQFDIANSEVNGSAGPVVDTISIATSPGVYVEYSSVVTIAKPAGGTAVPVTVTMHVASAGIFVPTKELCLIVRGVA